MELLQLLPDLTPSGRKRRHWSMVSNWVGGSRDRERQWTGLDVLVVQEDSHRVQARL